jgi:hypothetical protein
LRWSGMNGSLRRSEKLSQSSKSQTVRVLREADVPEGNNTSDVIDDGKRAPLPGGPGGGEAARLWNDRGWTSELLLGRGIEEKSRIEQAVEASRRYRHLRGAMREESAEGRHFIRGARHPARGSA